MKIPNWLKIVWWLVLVVVLTFFLRERLPDLLSGKAASADLAAFGVWAALLLAPLFGEVTLLGVTLKNEIEELKSHVAMQITEMRVDLRNVVGVQATFSPTFTLPSPPADAQLPAIEAQVKVAVAAALSEQGFAAPKSAADISISDDVNFLLATRYHIETELRRLMSDQSTASAERISMPPILLIRSLIESGHLSSRMGSAIREVMSICAPVIHGESASDAQVAFVRDVGPELIAALRGIR